MRATERALAGIPHAGASTISSMSAALEAGEHPARRSLNHSPDTHYLSNPPHTHYLATVHYHRKASVCLQKALPTC